jgi:CRP-like cAMP-binding protein
MTDFLEAKQREIEERLTELRPLVDEFHRLEAAAAALQGAQAPASPRRAAPRSSDSASGGRSANGSGRGRPRGSGTRGNEALELVKQRPGITIPELAEAMGIKQNYLYRVLPGLAQEGLVEKRGRGWHARVAA